MTGRDSKCAIWGTEATEWTRTDLSRVFDSSRAAGRYEISYRAIIMIRNLSEQKKVALTSWLVEQRRLGIECPEIRADRLDELFDRKALTVDHRAENLLRFIRARTRQLGDTVIFLRDSNRAERETGEEALAWTGSTEQKEIKYLIEHCEQMDWLSLPPEARRPRSQYSYKTTLTPSGYAHLATLDGDNVQSKQAFVAMWFDASMSEAYENGIKPAIMDAGFKPIRLDYEEYNNKIDDEIIAGISRSRFLVADFTHGDKGARGGVYYEAGIAQSLNIPVIFTCRKDVQADVHFDIRQQNFIFWMSPADLRDALQKRIEATIVDGPNKRTA